MPPGIQPSQPIKTLHVTNYYHASSGGIRTFYRALLEAANRHQRHVRLVVPGSEDSVEGIGSYGRIYKIAAPASPFLDARYRLLLPHLYVFPYRSRLRQILLAEKPDLVEVCDKYTLAFLPSVLRRNWIAGAAPAGVIGLSCERMDDNISAFLTAKPWGQRFAAWYMKRIYAPRFDAHISNSDYTAAEVSRAIGQSSSQPCVVCPMGVDVDGLGPRLRHDQARSALLNLFGPRPTSHDFRLLLFVGRLSPEKNAGLLLDTLEHLAGDAIHDYRLLIAGSGPLENWLRRQSESRVPRCVHFLGQVNSRERLAELYANCDVLIHPNPREPFGIVPLEAMASGLPVVAPRSGGILSYANPQNSWLTAPSVVAFSEAVRSVFANEELRTAKVSAALETASAFGWPSVTARFFSLYDQIYARLSCPSSLPN